MGGGEVADVDGAGAVVGELVGGGAADAEGGVGACYYDYFVFYSTAGAAYASAVFLGMDQLARRRKGTYGPAESPAMRRILGMPSKVPGSAGLTTSCSLRAWRRFLEADIMVGFASALTSRRSSSDGIVCRGDGKVTCMVGNIGEIYGKP